MVSASDVPQYLLVSLTHSVVIYSGSGSSIPFVMFRFPIFIISMVHLSLLLLLCKVFTLELAYRISMDFKRQQVFSRPQDSSQDYG